MYATKKTGGQNGRRNAPERGYYDLLGYVVSTAVAGEIMAVDNYTNMAPL